MGKKGKRKTSFLRKIYEKIISAPIEPDDPGEDVSIVEGNDYPPEEGEKNKSEQDKEPSEKKDDGEKTLEAGIMMLLSCDPYYKRHLQEVPDEKQKSSAPEIEQELKTAFELYSKGQESIACKEVGYVLRTLGQNPTEDEVIALVCEAGCDWEGNFTCDDFLKVAVASVQKQVNRLDDVRAAFRVFDNNGDGVISKNELKNAMISFGHIFSPQEADEMFTEADLNADGKIDWEEFLQMMLPGHSHKEFEDEDPSLHEDRSSRGRTRTRTRSRSRSLSTVH